MADLKAAEKSLKERGFAVRVFAAGKEAVEYLNSAIDGKTVGFGGSATVQELGIYEALAKHNETHWHWVNGPEERPVAAGAQIYIASANAVAETGEIINIDGAGNRVASMLYGHEKVYLVVGRNKLAPTYEEALWRARNTAAPLNAKRLERKTPCVVDGRCHDCKSPDRVCRALTVLWGPMTGMETEVVLIDQDLGF